LKLREPAVDLHPAHRCASTLHAFITYAADATIDWQTEYLTLGKGNDLACLINGGASTAFLSICSIWTRNADVR